MMTVKCPKCNANMWMDENHQWICDNFLSRRDIIEMALMTKHYDEYIELLQEAQTRLNKPKACNIKICAKNAGKTIKFIINKNNVTLNTGKESYCDICQEEMELIGQYSGRLIFRHNDYYEED